MGNNNKIQYDITLFEENEAIRKITDIFNEVHSPYSRMKILMELYKDINISSVWTNKSISHCGMERTQELYAEAKMMELIPDIDLLFEYHRYCNHIYKSSPNSLQSYHGYISIIDNDSLRYINISTRKINILCILSDDTLHIREVYDDLFEDTNKNSIVENTRLHSDMIIDYRLQIAYGDIYHDKVWSDCYPGNSYPKRCTIKYILDNNLGSKYTSQQTNFSEVDNSAILKYTKDCDIEVANMSKATEVVDLIIGAINEVPQEFIDRQMRMKTIESIIGED